VYERCVALNRPLTADHPALIAPDYDTAQMNDAIRLERVTMRTYRIRTSRFAGKLEAASSIESRREMPRAHALSRFATGIQRRRTERGATRAP
jgi:hypothetical protein